MDNGTSGILQQIFCIPLETNKFIVYAPLKGISFVANSSFINKMYEYCAFTDTGSSMSEEFGFLKNLNFFQSDPLPVDEYQEMSVKYDALILFLTNQCNLRCTYCYASSGESPKKQMSWEIAKASVDYVIKEAVKNNVPSFTLGFHGGGEPTLNFPVLKKTVDYTRSMLEKHNIHLNVTGAFNGAWSDRVVDYVINNFTDVSMSFDGHPLIQNKQRPAADRNGSFAKVFKTLKTLDDAGFSYGIRMTVTETSVPYLEESIFFICENLKPKKIQVEPVFIVGRAKTNKSQLPDVESFISQFIKGFKKAKQHGITLFYSGATLDRITTRFCLAPCCSLIVTTDGDITACFEVYGKDHPLSNKFIIGKYSGNNTFIFDKEKLYSHFVHTVNSCTYCETCFCKWHCAGDCSVKAHEAYGEPGPTERCYFNQELTKFLLLDKIVENNGLIWIKNREKPNEKI